MVLQSFTTLEVNLYKWRQGICAENEMMILGHTETVKEVEPSDLWVRTEFLAGRW